MGLNLFESDFKKSMSANKRPGTMQDVYNPVYMGIELYYKVQLVGEVIIISCKRK
ncbi:MAG: type II toxin-antitoxin system MqsR family toxin [Spirochaetales bacterium]|nr:type II toxin-antitoxin system MqsR family toxin [Spirochaetales bacterium]